MGAAPPGIVWLLWVHVAALPALAVIRGYGLLHGLQEASLVAVFALPAAHPAFARRARSTAAVLGVPAPAQVFKHPAAERRPWKWTLIHGAFVAAAGGELVARADQALYAARASGRNRYVLAS